MKYLCEYCNKNFNKQFNLNKHQRTAKYCLKLQNKKDDTPVTCNYCGNEFNRLDNLKRHEKVCSVKKNSEQQNGQLLEMIIQLQKTISNLSGSTNSNNNTTNNNRNVLMNLPPITDEEIQEHLINLTLDFIQEGGKGYATYANSYPFKDRILCTDKARKKLRYKDDAGELVEDGGGVKLAQMFFKAIAQRNEAIINAEYALLHEQVDKIANTKSAHVADLSDLLTKATHLQDLLIKSRAAAKGEENDLTKDFVSHLTKIL